MDVYFKPKNIKYITSRQPDIDTQKDIIEYLKAEYHEMLLYASKEVILGVKRFIDSPTYENFLSAVLAMRKDLWAKKSNLGISEIAIGKENT